MLRIQGLKKHYPGFALEMDMEVAPGRITGLIGENGAGKTTLFKSILRLIAPDAGEIRLLGKDITAFTEADMQMLGVVLTDSCFSGWLSIADVRAVLKAFYPAFDEQGFREGCARFGLDEKKKVKDLSGGMKGKLKLLAALTHGAKFLVLDEPTAGLDVLARDDLLTMLREYVSADDERSVLISSHISTDLETLCDDFYMIHAGRLVLHEETDRLQSDYAVLKIDRDRYASFDKTHLLCAKEESYGYACLTDCRAYYQEHAPETVMERSGLDELIMLTIRGEAV